TALMRAVRFGLIDVVRVLLDAGADANVTNSKGSRLLPAGLTARMEADQGEIVLELLKGGANPNASTPEGRTPLMFAASDDNSHTFGRIGVAEILLSHGADAARKDRNGLTALDYAIRDKNCTIAVLL